MEPLKEKLLQLNEDEYIKFMKEVHQSYPKRTVEVTNKIVNAWRKFQKKETTPVATKSGSSSGHQSNVVSSLDEVKHHHQGVLQSSSGQQSNPVSCLEKGASDQECKPRPCVPLPWQKSAWKTGVIFRGDKVPMNGNLFLDVEKVTLKKQPLEKVHKQKAATISIVNEDGKVVLWAFVKIPHDDICQYAHQITNLDERKLGIGVDIKMIHTFLDICLQGNQLIGVAIKNDLQALDYKFHNYLDLQNVYADEKGPFALGHIVKKLLCNRSGFQQGHHSAIDDARMTLAVYKHYIKATESGTFDKELDQLASSRALYKKEKPKFYSERCKCEK